MATAHILLKRKLKGIGSLDVFLGILARTKLSGIEKQILEYLYIEEKPMGWIADTLGFSEKTIREKHATALKKILCVL